MIQTGFGHSSKSNVFSNFHLEHLSNTCLLKPLLPCITLSSLLVYLSLILLSGLTQASPPYYLLRSTLSPDHLQTQVELKNFLASRDVFLHSGFCGKNNNHRTYALMAPANFGSRWSLLFAKLSMNLPTVSLNSPRWC